MLSCMQADGLFLITRRKSRLLALRLGTSCLNRSWKRAGNRRVQVPILSAGAALRMRGNGMGRDQQVQERLAMLRQFLAEGEPSGQSKPFDVSAIKAAGRKRMKATV